MEDSVDKIERLVSLSTARSEEQTNRETDAEEREEQTMVDPVKKEEEEEEKEANEAAGVSHGESKEGLLDSLVSNLPVSIPEDPGPESEEASLLISVVRD